MEELELYFKIKEVECDIDEMRVQMNRLRLEIDKQEYGLSKLNEIYENQFEKQEQPVTEQEEVKPKKLKKSNDKLSENNIEV